jgi:hypothetical protein
MTEPLENEETVANRLNVSVRTLQKWRWQGKGPRYIKLGAGTFGAVRYRQSDVDAYIAAGARASTSDPGATS